MKSIILKENEGMRLDIYLKEKNEKISRSYIKKLIKNGNVLVNGQRNKSGYIIKEDDLIVINFPDKVSIDLEPVNLNLDIVYEDDFVAVVNKRSGLVVHPSSTYKKTTLVHGLLYQLKDLSDINGTIRPGIIHRIDKDTSGLILIAKNNEAHAYLSEEIKKHHVKRKYFAIIKGHLKEKKLDIELPISRHKINRIKMAVNKEGKYALTHIKKQESYENYSLLDIELKTGRTHQIRVHLSHIGFPILGDPVYGKKLNDYGQYLHAYMISFIHPNTKEELTFKTKLPEEFEKVLKL